ncbi:beta-lactamase superfamily domain-containing protein [Apiospora kogelbergensis]|uniref:beta-lactamase superfamily domain-containing protein n=1 Tax=Apiospora kogelbergensis TaxID=1337665 RepID=UPI00312E403E
MSSLRHLHLDSSKRQPLLKDHTQVGDEPLSLPVKKVHTHPCISGGDEDASVYFIGTATTVIEWQGMRILTDPNFLHAGDHIHLGPGVTAERLTNPALALHELPSLDCILLSHYHADHFDQKVEASLNRLFPIITTPHAKKCLTSLKDEPFERVTELDFFESVMLHTGSGPVPGTDVKLVVRVTGTPGKHVPPGALAAANEFLQAVPPVNGWLVELGYAHDMATGADPETIKTGYRIYISGDTLFVDELQEIKRKLTDEKIDLMLIHLGGTTIPGPKMPLVMVTMDAEQGLKLMHLMDPDVTIPIHYDDYSVFLSPLSDFKNKVDEDGWHDRVVYLDRGEQYRFQVRAAEEA